MSVERKIEGLLDGEVPNDAEVSGLQAWAAERTALAVAELKVVGGSDGSRVEVDLPYAATDLYRLERLVWCWRRRRSSGVADRSSQMLEHAVTGATEAVAEKLNMNEGDPILKLRRLRFTDGTPMAIEESNIPLRLYPGLDRYDFQRNSLYAVLRESYGVIVAWADEVIEAVPATREESELLTIPKRASVLSISRLITSGTDMPIEAACSRYRGDRYRASIRVPGIAPK